MLCDWGYVVENASLQRTKIIESAEYGRFQITICADEKLAISLAYVKSLNVLGVSRKQKKPWPVIFIFTV
jgi:hypothetical protein